jgi:hypothetical protein
VRYGTAVWDEVAEGGYGGTGCGGVAREDVDVGGVVGGEAEDGFVA